MGALTATSDKGSISPQSGYADDAGDIAMKIVGSAATNGGKNGS
jgi:hypothetical protein